MASAPQRPALSGPEITAEGRLAGRVFAVLLVATGVGVIPAAALVFVGGTGWLVVDTLVRRP